MAQWVGIVVKIKKWALILSCTAFLFVISINVRAYSYEMYDLNNIVLNGDILLDSNSNGLADNFFATGSTIYSITNNKQKLNATGSLDRIILSTSPNYIDFKLNHKYYISWNMETNQDTLHTFALYSYNGITYLPLYNNTTTDKIDNNSFIYKWASSSYSSYVGFYMYNGTGGTPVPIGNYVEYDNLIVVDLSLAFGYGNEPSLSDFETLYLSNIPEYQNTGWFSSYSSYKPDSYITIDQNDYSDLGEDLTGVDYTKSVISNYGDNINIDMYVYINPSDSLTYDTFNIAWYIENNFPELKYLGNTYNLVWEQVDYSDHVIHLVMSDIQQDIFKRILFNRFIDQSDEYFKLEIECTPLTDISMWFEISTAFNLKVGIKSLLLARNTVTDNDFNMVNALYYKFIDISGDLMLPALKVNIGDTSKNTFINDFGSQYSDVSEFIIAFDIASPPLGSAYELETHYIYELGLFSSNNVFIPTMPTTSELEAMFPNDVCDWYQFGCQATNIINNIGETLYVKLNIPAIVAVFSGIIASISNIVAITPEPVAIIIYIVLGAVSTGLILLLVERIL